MLNDYKPTHDPNLDTFKVQYLLGGSAILAVLFPYRYEFTEVSFDYPPHGFGLMKCALTGYPSDALGLFDLARVCSYPTPAIHVTTHWRSRDDNDALSFRVGDLQSNLHT